jgi:transposase
LDIAKNVFQVHGVDQEGKVVITRQLRRGQVIVFFKKLAPCLIGMEACATAHHWGRELTELGHTVRLMPASYVKAYVKRSKNDAVRRCCELRGCDSTFDAVRANQDD